MNAPQLFATFMLLTYTVLAGNIMVTDKMGKPVKDAHVYYIHKDKKTHVSATTDEKGKAELKSPDDRSVIVFCAHPSYAAYRKSSHTPKNPLIINLIKKPSTGSIICPNGTGYVPGLIGRLNPILDTSNRLYMYAGNIALDRGKQQPVKFRLKKTIKAEDRDGNKFNLKVVDIIGRTSLIEFKKK